MLRKDLNKLDLTDYKPIKEVNKEQSFFETDEKITIKNYYDSSDLSNHNHGQSIAGLPPFVRGPYSSMYTNKPWTCLLYTSPSPRDY